jgi:MscS family membrane protein
LLGDKPFELGDRVIVGDIDGPVVEVGFRSTRIRTLDGNLVSIPNGDLANKAITNVGKRPSIRRIMNLGVTYDTPPEKVEKAVEIVKEVLKNHEGVAEEFPPRVYFNDFKDFSLNIFAIYWYHPADWWKYCEFSEGVNIEILKRFNAEGIEFAFPSQTLYLAGDEKRPVVINR